MTMMLTEYWKEIIKWNPDVPLKKKKKKNDKQSESSGS